MQRMDGYKEVLASLLASGHVYPCYMSVAELDALREKQRELNRMFVSPGNPR